MKIALITGSLPPDPCGVGDYTYKLYKALLSKGLNVDIILQKKWFGKQLIQVYKEAKNYDIIHIQYPTAGYKYSLGPHFLSILRPGIVTIHEASQANILRFLSLSLFTVSSLKLIFTTEYEKRYFEKYFPFIRNKSYIIPIGSNIPSFNIYQERKNEVVYFGLISPNKNIEDFIKLATICTEEKLQISFSIIGKIRDKRYYEKLRNLSKNLPITWFINLDELQLAEHLSKSTFAYLPFPDGASERRGSLLAVLINGVIPITTEGPYTPSDLKNVVFIANSPYEAFWIIKNNYYNKEKLKILSQNCRNYAQKYSWDYIAEQHIKIYKELINKH